MVRSKGSTYGVVPPGLSSLFDFMFQPLSRSYLADADVIAFHEPRSRNRGATTDGEAHGRIVDLPTVACQRGLQPAPQCSVCHLVSDLLKLCLGEPQTLFEEALTNLQRIVDH